MHIKKYQITNLNLDLRLNTQDLLSVLNSLNLHNSAERVHRLIPPLPTYEEASSVAGSLLQPPLQMPLLPVPLPQYSRQPVQHTSLIQQSTSNNTQQSASLITSNQHSSLIASLSIRAEESEQAKNGWCSYVWLNFCVKVK